MASDLAKLIIGPMAALLRSRCSCIVLFMGAFIPLLCINFIIILSVRRSPEKYYYSLDGTDILCPAGNSTPTCRPSNFYAENPSSSGEECPEYFRWIHEDLRPWERTGITRGMVEAGKEMGAHFRLVIVGGRVYVETYNASYQTRDVFTIWGILQVTRLYPGMLPDLDLAFHCGDQPVIPRSHAAAATKAEEEGNPMFDAAPPPMFDYCGNDTTTTIVFPDWSFWGWPEISMKPWDFLREELEEANAKLKWRDRQPYAYWKGNINSSPERGIILPCNVTEDGDWNARIYNLDWRAAYYEKYKGTNLSSQCTHRYKLYLEGQTWSVSEKYILACDSMALLISPRYYDFFIRSLIPLTHYWPVNKTNLCRSIKFAVDWGNSHPQKAEKIGMAGSKYIMEGLAMELVYDYVFHLLNEYSKLLKYKPTVPPGAVELCPEAMACNAHKLEKAYKMGTLVKNPKEEGPCRMVPPYDPTALQALLRRKQNLIRRVEALEREGNTRAGADF